MNIQKYNVQGYPGNFTEVWGVQSETRPDKVYTVALSRNNVWSCGCPRWTLTPSRPECKHIKYIKSIRNKNVAVLEMPVQLRRKFSTFANIEV
jgi:hypothetical protein